MAKPIAYQQPSRLLHGEKQSPSLMPRICIYLGLSQKAGRWGVGPSVLSKFIAKWGLYSCFLTESGSLVGMRIAIFDFSDSPYHLRVCINISSRLIMAVLKLGAAVVPESDELDWNAIMKSIFVNTPGLILNMEAFENGDRAQIFSD